MCKTKNELRSTVAKYRRLKSAEAALKQELQETQQELFEFFETHNIAPKEKVIGQNFVVSYSNCTNKFLDKDKVTDLVSSLGYELADYQKETNYKRIYVK